MYNSLQNIKYETYLQWNDIFRVDWDKYYIEAEGAVIDPVVLQGPYKINGKVLILPITGQGISNITQGKYLLVFQHHSWSSNLTLKQYRKQKKPQGICSLIPWSVISTVGLDLKWKKKNSKINWH